MCMLYALSSRKKLKLKNSLAKFFAFSSFHPHGWGIAAYNDNKEARLIKDKETANTSMILKKIIDKGVPTKLAIAHIRYATTGDVALQNTHPFTAEIMGDKWVFAHNGSVSIGNLRLYIKPSGETDSEEIFCYMNQGLVENVATTLNKKIEVIEHCIRKFSKESKLNLVISDGQYLFIHCNFRNSMYWYRTNESVYIATRPLSDTIGWKSVNLNRLIIFEEGKMIYEGKKHVNEFKRKEPI